MIFHIKANSIKKSKVSKTFGFCSCCLLLFIAFTQIIHAQSKQLELLPLDKSADFLTEKIAYSPSIEDTPSLTTTLSKIRQDLHQQGYLAASVDSIFLKDSLTYVALLHVGDRYEWLQLKNGNVEEDWLSKAGFREQLYSGKAFNIKRLRQLQDALLSEAENNGFPFAKTQLDSVSMKKGRVAAQLMLDKGELIVVDTMYVQGEVEISKKYLENYLGIFPDEPYDKSKIIRIPQRIKELPFVQSAKPLDVTFYGNRAIINLYLKPKKASRFDFIVGVLPNTTTNGNVQATTFTLTGDLKGEFYNAFGYGEQILVELEQLRPATPRLNLSVNYPYVLNLPFGVDGELLIYKQDTTLLEVASDLGVQYLLEGGNYLKAFWNTQSSDLLSIDSIQVRQQARLPENLDFQRSSFGLEYLQQQLDYRFNPRKGWSVFLRGSAGVKNITPNSQILALSNEDVDFQALYDSLSLNSFQYIIGTTLAGYLPLGKRATLKLQNQSQLIFSDAPIVQNEQFRIGGNKLLRGFDEQSVLATQYALFTLEPRLLISTNSYFYAFADYAWIRDATNARDVTNNAFGFGAGLTLETGVGVFGISLALGRRADAPFNFRNPKIHFGYVSLF